MGKQVGETIEVHESIGRGRVQKYFFLYKNETLFSRKSYNNTVMIDLSAYGQQILVLITAFL